MVENSVGLAMADPKRRRSQEVVELVPDAWPRFERFIREIAKAGPQHRKPKPKTTSKPKRGKDRVSKA
jgi:hypothetical protein